MNRILAVLLTALLVSIVCWRVIIASQVNSRLRRIKASGYPSSPQELNAWYKAVPEGDNAALTFLEGGSKISEPNAKLARSLVEWLNNGSLSPSPTPELRAQLEQWTQTNQPALSLLHKASALSASRYPVDLSHGVNTQLPHLTQLKRATQLLAAQASTEMDHGQFDKAADEVLTMLKLAQSLSAEPVLISQLVRFSSQTLAVLSLQKVVNRGSLTEPVIQRLGSILAEIDSPDGLIRGLAGDRASAVDAFRFGKVSIDNAEPVNGDTDSRPNGPAARLFARTTGFFDRDLCFYLDTMETNLIQVALAPPQNVQAAKYLDMRSVQARRRWCILSSLMLPAFEKTSIRDTEQRARLRTALAAVVIELYRSRHNGQAPANLNELPPSDLKAVPADPFNGQALRYKADEHGYVIYSVGADQSDDGGKEPSPRTRGGQKEDHSDITFKVRY